MVPVVELKSTDIEDKLRLDKLPGDQNKKDSLLKNVTHFFNYLLRGGAKEEVGEEHDENVVDYSGFLSAAIAYAYLQEDLDTKVRSANVILLKLQGLMKEGEEKKGFPTTVQDLLLYAALYREDKMVDCFKYDAILPSGTFHFFDFELEIPSNKAEDITITLNSLVELTFTVMLHIVAKYTIEHQTRVARRVFGRPISMFHILNTHAHPGYEHDDDTKHWYHILAKERLQEEVGGGKKIPRILISSDVTLLDDFVELKQNSQWNKIR